MHYFPVRRLRPHSPFVYVTVGHFYCIVKHNFRIFPNGIWSLTTMPILIYLMRMRTHMNNYTEF